MDFAALTRALSGKNFLIIGRAGMDIYPHPAGVRTEDAEHFFTCLGGSSANIGVALVKLGARATLVTSVSDDAVGRFALNQLDKYGINRDYVRTVGGEYRTSLAVVESRVEDHQSVIYRNLAADFQMEVADVQAPDYTQFSALITTGTVLAAEPSRTACFRAFELARAAGLPIILDLDYRPYSWPSADEAAEVYARAGSLCDVVIGNDDEFGVMAGDYAKGRAFAEGLADSACLVVYKLGERGAVSFCDGKVIETSIYPVKPLKPTGAGDSFMGGLIASLADGHSALDSLKRGSACAAIVVGKVGCAPAMPSGSELMDFLDNNEMLVMDG